MVISVSCPKCRRPLQFAGDAAGRVAACPCGQQMTLPHAPIPAAAPPRSGPTRRSAPTPARRPAGGGGGGAAPIVAVVLLLLAGVGGLVFFKHREADKEFSARKADDEKRKAEEAAKAEAEKRYVMLRVWIDDAVLPADKRSVAEGQTQYLGVRVEVANHGYDVVSVDPQDFSLMVDGQRYGRLAAGVAEKFDPRDLKDGEKVMVPVAFEVPDAHKAVTVDFNPGKPAPKPNLRYGDAR